MKKSWILSTAALIAVPAQAEVTAENGETADHDVAVEVAHASEANMVAEPIKIDVSDLSTANTTIVETSSMATTVDFADASLTDTPTIAPVPAGAVVNTGAVAAATAGDGVEGSSSGHGLPNYLNTAIQYAYSWDADNDFIIGYGSDTDDRHQVRLEHQQTWKYGNLYFFADRIAANSNLGGERDFGFPCCGDGKDVEYFGLVNANISLSRVLDKPLKLGPIKDFGPEFRAEYGTFFDYKGFSVGAFVDLDIPGFDGPGEFVRLNYWRRFNDDDFVSSAFDAGGAATERYADHNFWGITLRNTFDLANTRLEHQTFFRYQQESEGGPDELQRFNRIFWETELFAYLTDRLSVGFRSEYFRDSGGISFGGDKSDWRPIVAIRYDIFRQE